MEIQTILCGMGGDNTASGLNAGSGNGLWFIGLLFLVGIIYELTKKQ